MNVKFTAGIVALEIWNILDSDDEDAERKSQTLLAKVERFSEEIVPNMTHKQFQIHFRMSPRTFEDFLLKMHVCSTPVFKKGQPEIPLQKRCLIMIWCLANPECFRSVADRFGIAISSCWRSLYLTCKEVLKLNHQYKIINWPTGDRAATISNYFAGKVGLTGVIGCIDGSHIPIKAPKRSQASYVNRKGFHSLLLQGVCDHELLFTDCYTGEAGSIHDALLFQRSDLNKAIQQGLTTFPNNSFMVGDAAYPLKEYLIPPFKNTGYLSERQKKFNVVLSKVRQVIERSFALLKGRFRRLKFLETVRQDLAVLLIMSACVMHNLCILKGDVIDVQDNIPIDSEQVTVVCAERPTRTAINKRNAIVNRL